MTRIYDRAERASRRLSDADLTVPGQPDRIQRRPLPSSAFVSGQPIRRRVYPETYGDEISIGDRALIWRSEGGKPGSGGLVAVGQVESEARPMPDDFAPGEYLDRSLAGRALRIEIA